MRRACLKNYIALMIGFPNSTHCSQLADVAIIKQLKQNINKILREMIEEMVDDYEITYLDILAALIAADKKLNPECIRRGVKLIGFFTDPKGILIIT